MGFSSLKYYHLNYHQVSGFKLYLGDLFWYLVAVIDKMEIKLMSDIKHDPMQTKSTISRMHMGSDKRSKQISAHSIRY